MKLREKYEAEVKQFVKVCHELAADKYATGTGGNLAWRLEEDLILITPTRHNKGDITKKDVVFVNLAGDVVEGTKRPTGELPMYVKFFNERPDIVTVIHCHPANVCAMAITDGPNWLMAPLYPETTIEIGPVPVVPYAQPLTQELADKFAPFLQKYNSFIMENHGLVSMSTNDIRWTHANVVVLESTAAMVFLALNNGGIKTLSFDDVMGLSQVMEERELPLFGVPGVNKRLVDLYFDADGKPLF